MSLDPAGDFGSPGGSGGGGSGATASLSRSNVGSSAVTLTLALSAGSTLISWSIQRRKWGGSSWGAWSTIASGLNNLTYQALGLDPSPSMYEFQGIDVIMQISAESNVVGVATEELPPIPLTSWAQIEGGMQFGGAFVGGSQWWWDVPVDGTFYANFVNQETENVIAAQAIIEGAGDVGAMTGWGIQSGGTWDTDSADYQPPAGGSVASPKVVESAELALTFPITPGSTAQYQELRAPATIVPATSLSGNGFPTTSVVSSENFLEGAYLGSNPGGGFPGLGPMASRIYLRKAGDPLYVFGVIGDSTTVPVQPLDSVTPLSREGYHFRANQALRSAGKRVRVYSYGQGAAGWSDILARGRALLPHLSGKISRLATLVWTWNTAWLTIEQAQLAWAEYLVWEAEVEASGIGSSPMILNPYTNRNATGQPEAFAYLKAQVQAHPRGIVLDEIMGGSDWPNLPASESEDNVHQNGVGAVRTGPLAATEFLRVASIDYPELA